MKKLLVIVDMQNDFIDGSLGTPEAQAIVSKVIDKINSWDGEVAYTMDKHDDNYLSTNEGRHLPIKHCIENTFGEKIQFDIGRVLFDRRKDLIGIYNKTTFGCIDLANHIAEMGYDHIEIVGLCTDICVIANALLIKTYNQEADVVVDASCCAGTTPEKHNEALSVMQSCQIDII